MSMPANIRFGDLVRSSGRPTVHTLWTKPGRDKAFMQARKQNRVLTVVQDPTHRRKDYGEIGFHERQSASYLVFPRPLPTKTLGACRRHGAFWTERWGAHLGFGNSLRSRCVASSRSIALAATASVNSSHSGPSVFGSIPLSRKNTIHAPSAARLLPSMNG